MQDRWILQARATNAILYDCIRVILFLYGERIQQRCDRRGYKGANLPDKINAKTELPFAYISIFSTFLVFSKLFFACFESFWTYFPVISSFSI